MTRKIFAIGLLMTSILASRSAAIDMTTPSLSPGRYTVNVVPGFNHYVAERIEKQLKNIPEIKSVSARTLDSTIDFTVKKNAQVDPVTIQNELQVAHAGSVMTTPVLVHTHTAFPGF